MATALPTKEGKIAEMKSFLKIALLVFLGAFALSLSGIQLCAAPEDMADLIGFILIFGACYAGFGAYSYFEYATWGMDLKLFSACQGIQDKARSSMQSKEPARQGDKKNPINKQRNQRNQKYEAKIKH